MGIHENLCIQTYNSHMSIEYFMQENLQHTYLKPSTYVAVCCVMPCFCLIWILQSIIWALPVMLLGLWHANMCRVYINMPSGGCSSYLVRSGLLADARLIVNICDCILENRL